MTINTHRVRVVLESLHQLLDVLVKHGMERDLLPLSAARRVGSSRRESDRPFRDKSTAPRAVRLDSRPMSRIPMSPSMNVIRLRHADVFMMAGS